MHLKQEKNASQDEVRAMSITIHSGLKTKILEAQSEASKDLKAPTEWLRGLETHFEQRDDGEIYFFDRIWIPSVGGEALGTRLDMSTAYHPQTDGQSERTIQTLEDMLRACVMDFGGSWDTHLPLIEFSYNNSYHTSIKCAPFEALYGRKCRSPVIWTEVGESQLIGPEIVQETTEKIVQIKERLKTARFRQKSYTDKEAQSVFKYLWNEIEIDENLRFVEEPIEIVERDVKKLKRRRIPLVKVRWNSRQGAEYTWEREDQFRKRYPNLFSEPVPSSNVAT
ncbi:putative reverse transcriptase domain-containing protein [Tanacetum coccineum]